MEHNLQVATSNTTHESNENTNEKRWKATTRVATTSEKRWQKSKSKDNQWAAAKKNAKHQMIEQQSKTMKHMQSNEKQRNIIVHIWKAVKSYESSIKQITRDKQQWTQTQHMKNDE